MRLTSRHRLRIAFVAIFCLLFQQLAVAAYTCREDAPATVEAMPAHCAEMLAPEQDNAPLCDKHCTPDLSRVADHAQPAVPALALPALEFAPLPATKRARPALSTDAAFFRSDPPPRLRFCSLLI